MKKEKEKNFEQAENIKVYCPVCKKDQWFISTSTGYHICGICHYRTNFKKTRLIEDEFGYHIKKENRTKEIEK